MTETQRDDIVRESGWRVHPYGEKGNCDWFWIYSDGKRRTKAYRELTLGWKHGRCRVFYWVDANKYGVRKDYHNPMMTLLSAKTPIPNLYLTGQSLTLHGLLGVTMTSLFTVSEIIGKEEAWKITQTV